MIWRRKTFQLIFPNLVFWTFQNKCFQSINAMINKKNISVDFPLHLHRSHLFNLHNACNRLWEVPITNHITISLIVTLWEVSSILFLLLFCCSFYLVWHMHGSNSTTNTFWLLFIPSSFTFLNCPEKRNTPSTYWSMITFSNRGEMFSIIQAFRSTHEIWCSRKTFIQSLNKNSQKCLRSMQHQRSTSLPIHSTCFKRPLN